MDPVSENGQAGGCFKASPARGDGPVPGFSVLESQLDVS